MIVRITEPMLSLLASVAVLAIVALRGADLWSNGTYMQTHQLYWGIYYVDVLIVFGGVVLLSLYAANNRYRHLAGALFAIFGFAAVIADPDFSHFVRDPIIFFSTDLVFTTLFLVGTPFTAILLITTLKGQRRITMESH